MFRAHRPIFRRVRTAVHTTIVSVSVRSGRVHTEHASRADRYWTNGCVNNCTNCPEDGPVGPKHVETQQYTNKIVTSVGFHSKCSVLVLSWIIKLGNGQEGTTLFTIFNLSCSRCTENEWFAELISALYWGILQHIVVIPHRCFGRTVPSLRSKKMVPIGCPETLYVYVWLPWLRFFCAFS